jgi:hypothetical protein
MSQPPLDEQAIEMILRNESGYPFELEIARRMAEAGYIVEPNYGFQDHDTGQSRELDFRAVGFTPLRRRTSEFVTTIVLGSCKSNRVPYVFFTRPPLPTSRQFLHTDLPIAGYPLRIYINDFEQYSLEEYLNLHKVLHIGKPDKVSSQFCELTWDKNGKKHKVGQDKDGQGAIFKDIYVPLVKAMSRELEDSSDILQPSSRESPPLYEIYYPLLVVRGPLFEYYFPANGTPVVRKAEHIILSRSYRSETVTCHYAIDVVHESYLERYLDLIDKEVLSFRNLIRHHRGDLVRSVERLVALSEDAAKFRAL